MPKIQFEGQEIECEENENLRRALLRAGAPLYNGAAKTFHCRGIGTCGTCAIEIEGQVSEMTDIERWRLGFLPHQRGAGLRLACQCKVRGDLSLTKHPGFWGQQVSQVGGDNSMDPIARIQRRCDQWIPKPLLAAALLLIGSGNCVEHDARAEEPNRYQVSQPLPELNLPAFYAKYVDATGYPIVGSSRVDDYALKEAAFLIDMMLAKRPDVREAMVQSGSRMIVMSHDEYTTDIPEHSHLKPKQYWDARARGLGGSRTDPVCSSAEENLLAYQGDPYSTENILIHEFAHNMHYRGMNQIDPTFDDRLKKTYERAMAQGLWKDKYAATNHAEYFAEGVQSWFNNNRPPDSDHNHVDTRAELKQYDPELASICEEVYGDTTLVYTKPTTRLHGHMEGYDPSTAPKFQWSKEIQATKKEN